MGSSMSTPIDYTYEDNTPNTSVNVDENFNLNFQPFSIVEDSSSAVRTGKRVSIPRLSEFVKLMEDVNDNSKEVESKSDDTKEDDINSRNKSSNSRSGPRKDTSYPQTANRRPRSANIYANVKIPFKSKMYPITTTNHKKIRSVDVDKVINGGSVSVPVGSTTAHNTAKTKSTPKCDESSIVTENLGSVSTLVCTSNILRILVF